MASVSDARDSQPLHRVERRARPQATAAPWSNGSESGIFTHMSTPDTAGSLVTAPSLLDAVDLVMDQAHLRVAGPAHRAGVAAGVVVHHHPVADPDRRDSGPDLRDYTAGFVSCYVRRLGQLRQAGIRYRRQVAPAEPRTPSSSARPQAGAGLRLGKVPHLHPPVSQAATAPCHRSSPRWDILHYPSGPAQSKRQKRPHPRQPLRPRSANHSVERRAGLVLHPIPEGNWTRYSGHNATSSRYASGETFL